MADNLTIPVTPTLARAMLLTREAQQFLLVAHKDGIADFSHLSVIVDALKNVGRIVMDENTTTPSDDDLRAVVESEAADASR